MSIKIIKTGSEPGIRDAVSWLERMGIGRLGVRGIHLDGEVGEPLTLSVTFVGPDLDEETRLSQLEAAVAQLRAKLLELREQLLWRASLGMDGMSEMAHEITVLLLGEPASEVEITELKDKFRAYLQSDETRTERPAGDTYEALAARFRKLAELIKPYDNGGCEGSYFASEILSVLEGNEPVDPR